MVLLMVRDRLLLYSAGSGVKSVAVDLSGLRMRSLVVVHWWMVLRYGWRWVSAVW